MGLASRVARQDHRPRRDTRTLLCGSETGITRREYRRLWGTLQLKHEDLRKLPRALGKPIDPASARRIDGIFLSHFERGVIGPDLSTAARQMDLERPNRPTISAANAGSIQAWP